MISKAPGRICLFGDHQDYLQLPIIACAINRYITIEGIPNDKDNFHILLPDMENERVIRFRESVPSIQKGDHLIAALKVVKRYGCIPDKGYCIEIKGTIPINAGLSSSSAMVVAWVQWLLTTFGCDPIISPELIGKIAYEAEVIEQHSPGGKMDQYTSALGNLLYLETNELSYFQKMDTSLKGLIVGESGIPKNTIGLLGTIKNNALQAIALVTKKIYDFDLSHATLSDYESYKNLLPNELQPFLYASIKNHLITQEARVVLSKKTIDYKHLGHLLNAHHDVLKNVLHITVPRIDMMIDAALQHGAYGAKIVGSGGGGSICALAPEKNQQTIIDAIIDAGAHDAYSVQISKGTHIL